MKKLSPMEQEAKMKVLQECMDSMDDMMGSGLDSKKKMKATVMASSKHGLEQGLEKAADVIEGDDESTMGDHIMDESEHEDEDMSEASPEEIQAKIEELKMLLQSKSKKSDVKMPF